MKANAKKLGLVLYKSIERYPESVDEIISLFALKIHKDRQMKYLPKIIREMNNLQIEKKIIVTSRFPLSASQLREIKEVITKIIPDTSSYKIENNVSAIIGGITIETNNKILDFSIDNTIEKLKEQLWKNK